MKKNMKTAIVLSICLILGIFSTVFVMAAEGVFTIKKVDQNNNPIEGVDFEVYGKPTLEVQMPVTITKVWDLPQDTEFAFLPYIERDITIKIEGVDNNYSESFKTSAGVSSKEFKLQPGRYKISELMPDTETLGELEDRVEREQSYLESYEIVIDEKGKLSDGGKKDAWKILTYIYKIDAQYSHTNEEGHHEYSWRDYDPLVGFGTGFPKIELNGNNIVISNCAYTQQQESQVQE